MPIPRLVLIAACLCLLSCSIVETTYDVTVGTLKLGYEVTKFAGKTVYHVGRFTYTVVMAPLSWPLTNDDIESLSTLFDMSGDTSLEMHPVSTDVNSVRNNRAELIEEIDPLSPASSALF